MILLSSRFHSFSCILQADLAIKTTADLLCVSSIEQGWSIKTQIYHSTITKWMVKQNFARISSLFMKFRSKLEVWMSDKDLFI